MSALAALAPTGLIGSPAWAATELIPADIKPGLAPNQAEYDPTDEKLRDAASLLQQALNANDVQVSRAHLVLSREQYALRHFVSFVIAYLQAL